MELTRLQTLAEAEARLRSDLVTEVLGGTDGAQALNRAQVLGYDLSRPHRVVVVEGCYGADQVGEFFHAVRRAAGETRVGSLLAIQPDEVVVLAHTETAWEKFRAAVAANSHGAECRIGVGGRRGSPDEIPHSYHEAQLALKIQKAAGGHDRTTLFDDLGVYQVLATGQNSAAMERFVHEWLGSLTDYDGPTGARAGWSSEDNTLDQTGRYALVTAANAERRVISEVCCDPQRTRMACVRPPSGRASAADCVRWRRGRPGGGSSARPRRADG